MCGRMIRIGSRVKFRSLQLDFGGVESRGLARSTCRVLIGYKVCYYRLR